MWGNDPEERREQLEKKKKEAAEKTKLGDTGKPLIITTDQIIDRLSSWVHYFRADENMRNAYGVKTVDKKWVIIDKAKFDKVSGERREALRPFWGKPL